MGVRRQCTAAPAAARSTPTTPENGHSTCAFCPATIEDAWQRVGNYEDQYNNARLHRAIGYGTPADKLNGLEKHIFDERDRTLKEARERGALSRQAVACDLSPDHTDLVSDGG